MLVCPRCFNAFAGGDRCAIDNARLASGEHIVSGRKIDRFELSALIASGRTSRVYRALDPRTRKDVALKIFHGEIATDKKLAGRLAIAAKEKGKLDRLRFVPVVDADLTRDGVVYVARELAGESLAASLHRQGARSPRQVAPLVQGIALALSKLHWSGQLYEDLRPSAVMLQGDEVRLLEPGSLAVLKTASKEVLDALGGSMPRPQHVAPEVVAGEKTTTLSDLYVLGVILYELLIGFPPFNTERGHLEDPVPSIALEFCGLSELARELLDKNPAKRPQAAAAVIARLERLGISELPRVAEPRSTSEPAPLPRRTGSRMPAMLAVGGVAVAIAAGGYMWTSRVDAFVPPRQPPVEELKPVVIKEEQPATLPVPEITQPPPAEKKVVARKVEVVAEDPLLTAYASMDGELGRVLTDRGLVWDDLAAVAPNDARQWGRWYKKEKIPSLEALNATFESLKNAADRAKKTKTSTLSG